MTIIEAPTGTLSALGPRRLEAIAGDHRNSPPQDHCRPPIERLARHIGRELLEIRHDRARLAEALLHLSRL